MERKNNNMSKVEDKIDALTGRFYGTVSPKNEQGAIFGVMVETLRQQVITNQRLLKQQELLTKQYDLLEKQYKAMRPLQSILVRILIKVK